MSCPRALTSGKPCPHPFSEGVGHHTILGPLYVPIEWAINVNELPTAPINGVIMMSD